MTSEDPANNPAPAPDPALQAQLRGADVFDWTQIRQHIPKWTPEEQAEHAAFWTELDRDRRSRGHNHT